MLLNLKVLRSSLNLTQEEFAALIGCNRANYSRIEAGKRQARMGFWQKVQKAANVNNSDMWDLIINTEKGLRTCEE